MSKTLIEAKLPSLKDKINGITPKDTVETIVEKVKKEGIKKLKVGSKLGVKKGKKQ